jgi:glycosyltransferase involved in cell wall biosynthesis
MPKILIIGNMNNNGFALMRYFRDLGADAHLLPYTNDGRQSLSHFKPEADTSNFERWSPFVLDPVFTNGIISAVPAPFDLLMMIWARLRRTDPERVVIPLNKKVVSGLLAGFDFVIGSGVAPAALQRLGRQLDIFYPYSPGVEFLEASWFTRLLSGHFLRRQLVKLTQHFQKTGIKRTHIILNAETGMTEEVLRRHGVPSLRHAVPMVYNRENITKGAPSEKLRGAADKLSYELIVLHHSRLMWSSCASDESKHNDWLFRGFAAMRSRSPKAEVKLLVVEYGPDVEATKRLVAELGLTGHVEWLSKMSRRDLTWLISKVDIVFGEVMSAPRTLWGGTGWEALAYGSALMQGFLFEEGEFSALFGHPPPPMLGIKSMDDVEQHLVRAVKNPESLHKIGAEAKVWFDQYNGISLAKRWLELLTEERSLPAAQTDGQGA